MALNPKLERGQRSRRRRVDELFDVLDEADTDVLKEWLTDVSISPERIARELNADGHSISAGAIAGYRLKVLGVGRRMR